MVKLALIGDPDWDDMINLWNADLTFLYENLN